MAAAIGTDKLGVATDGLLLLLACSIEGAQESVGHLSGQSEP